MEKRKKRRACCKLKGRNVQGTMLKDKFIAMPGLDEKSLRDKTKDHAWEGELCQWLEEQLENNGLDDQQQQARCIVGVLKQSRQDLAQDIKEEPSQYMDLLDVKKFMNEEPSIDELRKLVIRHVFHLTVSALLTHSLCLSPSLSFSPSLALSLSLPPLPLSLSRSLFPLCLSLFYISFMSFG